MVLPSQGLTSKNVACSSLYLATTLTTERSLLWCDSQEVVPRQRGQETLWPLSEEIAARQHGRRNPSPRNRDSEVSMHEEESS